MGEFIVKPFYVMQHITQSDSFFQVTIEHSPTGSMSGPSSMTQSVVQLRSQSILFSKLFVIMGITWLGEAIHVLVHGDHSQMNDCSFYYEVCAQTKVNIYNNRYCSAKNLSSCVPGICTVFYNKGREHGFGFNQARFPMKVLGINVWRCSALVLQRFWKQLWSVLISRTNKKQLCSST